MILSTWKIPITKLRITFKMPTRRDNINTGVYCSIHNAATGARHTEYSSGSSGKTSSKFSNDIELNYLLNNYIY